MAYNSKKSQAWSFDIIIAVLIFIGAFFSFYFLLKPQTDNPIDKLEKEADIIAHELLSESSPINIVEDGKINSTKLQDLLAEDYSTLKSHVRVENDFCIYLEDEDGNLVSISTGVGGVGSSKINVSDLPCS